MRIQNAGDRRKEKHYFRVSLITASLVIPAKTGIQKKPGFLVKPGMTTYMSLASSSVFLLSHCILFLGFWLLFLLLCILTPVSRILFPEF